MARSGKFEAVPNLYSALVKRAKVKDETLRAFPKLKGMVKQDGHVKEVFFQKTFHENLVNIGFLTADQKMKDFWGAFNELKEEAKAKAAKK